jgi:glutamate 5-kinase
MAAPTCWCCSPTSTASTPRRRIAIPAQIPDPVVERITPEIEAMAGGAASELSRGGMRTKIEAGKIATAAGTAMIIARSPR